MKIERIYIKQHLAMLFRNPLAKLQHVSIRQRQRTHIHTLHNLIGMQFTLSEPTGRRIIGQNMANTLGQLRLNIHKEFSPVLVGLRNPCCHVI